LVELVRIETAQDIADTPPVKRVRRLEIVGSDLETLEGLECIEWVETLRVEDNPRLRWLTGLDGLVDVKEEPCDEPWATAGCVMPPLDNGPVQLPPGVGDAIIAGNPRLESMSGLVALEHVNASFEIRDNASLRSLEGLESLASVTQPYEMVLNAAQSALRIERNPRLESLAGLESYVRGARLEVRDNAALTELFAPRASYPEYSGGLGALVLEDLPRLTTLEGLTDWSVGWLELRRVPLVEGFPRMYAEPEPTPPGAPDRRFMHRLVIESNPALRSLVGIPPVAVIEGQLVVRDNDALQDLAGLERLEIVSGDRYDSHPLAVDHTILIEGNAALSNLDALNPAIDGSLRGYLGSSTSAILDNPALPTCLVEQFLDELLYTSSWVVDGNGGGPCP
jgi:hypothetical protein